MRLLAIFSIALAAATVGATVYHVPPRAVSADLHLRVALHPDNVARWGLRWRATDSLNYHFAEMSAEGTSAADNTYGSMLTLTLGALRDGATYTTTTRKIFGQADLDRPGSGISLRLTASSLGSTLAIGSDRELMELPLGIAVDSLLCLETVTSPAATAIIDRFTCDTLPAPITVAPPDSVMAKLRRSSDPFEGLWTILDRNTDPLLSRMGGRYTLATLRHPSGTGYGIVYLDGATEQARDWQPGRLKGQLIPTLIPGVFDLTWYQPDGTILDTDTGAIMENPGTAAILTLQFPRWKATIRLRRLPLP